MRVRLHLRAVSELNMFFARADAFDSMVRVLSRRRGGGDTEFMRPVRLRLFERHRRVRFVLVRRTARRAFAVCLSGRMRHPVAGGRTSGTACIGIVRECEWRVFQSIFFFFVS